LAGKIQTEFFKVEEFWKDINFYMWRNKITKTELFRAAGLGRYLKEKFPPLSLRTACRLADMCDLSLDTYIIREFGK